MSTAGPTAAHGRMPPVAFRPDPALRSRLAERARTRGAAGSAGLAAARDLGRYYALLERGLREVDLDERQALLICDALNGTLIDERTALLLDAEVAEAISLDELDLRWGVDVDRLMRTLTDAPTAARYAICDAVERWWALDEPADPGERLRAVGLTRDDPAPPARAGAARLGEMQRGGRRSQRREP